MADAFFYQDAENTVQGPLAPAALKQLANEGVIGETTLVRKGDTGPWYQAGKIPGLIPVAAKPAEAETFPNFATETPSRAEAPDRTRRTIKKAEEQAEKVAAKLWFLDLKFSQFYTPKLAGPTWALYFCVVIIVFLTDSFNSLNTMKALPAFWAILHEFIILAFSLVFFRILLEVFLVIVQTSDRLAPLKHLEYLKHLENPQELPETALR